MHIDTCVRGCTFTVVHVYVDAQEFLTIYSSYTISSESKSLNEIHTLPI